MAGLFGFGLGVALMWAEIRTHSWLAWLLTVVAFVLVFRAGRRRSAGPSAVAVASANASAKSEAAAASNAVSAVSVNVFVPGRDRSPAAVAAALDEMPWLMVGSTNDRSGQRSLTAEYDEALLALDDESLIDTEDPVEVLYRAQLGHDRSDRDGQGSGQ